MRSDLIRLFVSILLLMGFLYINLRVHNGSVLTSEGVRAGDEPGRGFPLLFSYKINEQFGSEVPQSYPRLQRYQVAAALAVDVGFCAAVFLISNILLKRYIPRDKTQFSLAFLLCVQIFIVALVLLLRHLCQKS